MTRQEDQKKVVLLTGASTGLGLACLKELIKRNDLHIIATARQESLNRFKEMGIEETESLWIRPLNVLVKNERDAVVNEASEKLGGIDVLINNAAYCLRAVVEHVNETERLKQIDTNFRAPMALVKGVLPLMRKKRSGQIINISSVGGMMAMPTMSIYSASKFALEGATEALWYEVKPWNIKVSLVEPGFINSDSFTRVKLTKDSQKSLEDRNEPYHFHYSFMATFIEKLMTKTPATTDRVAKKIAGLVGSKNPPLRYLATPDAVVFDLLRRFLPRRFYHWLLYKMLPGVRLWGDSWLPKPSATTKKPNTQQQVSIATVLSIKKQGEKKESFNQVNI